MTKDDFLQAAPPSLWEMGQKRIFGILHGLMDNAHGT
jgi:hypothetical protein